MPSSLLDKAHIFQHLPINQKPGYFKIITNTLQNLPPPKSRVPSPFIHLYVLIRDGQHSIFEFCKNPAACDSEKEVVLEDFFLLFSML